MWSTVDNTFLKHFTIYSPIFILQIHRKVANHSLWYLSSLIIATVIIVISDNGSEVKGTVFVETVTSSVTDKLGWESEHYGDELRVITLIYCNGVVTDDKDVWYVWYAV